MQNKKVIIVIVTLLIVVAVSSLKSFSNGGEDSWLCKDGQWVKHGNPSTDKPSNSSCEK